MLEISELYIYPVKSLPGMRLRNAMVTDKGFQYDRRWMLIDNNGRFISQREVPQMTRLQVAIDGVSLKITVRDGNDDFLYIPLENPAPALQTEVTVWDDTCAANFVSHDTDEWFSRVLGIPCRLVYMPDDTMRIVDQKYAGENSVTSFSDAYPFLVIGEASLADLNTRLNEPVPMDRFRPNIVLKGGNPFEEDLLAHFVINDIHFYGVKLCARCIITTIDQYSGEKGKEPLKTLATYRFKNNKILFGQNLIHEGAGYIAVGDSLQIVSKNNDERFKINNPAAQITPLEIDKTFGIIVK